MGKVQESFAAWCRRNGREKLLELYDEAANETSAGEISFSSAVPRNWRCPDCGMSWRGSPNKMNRLRPGTYHVIRKRRTETYCPYCKGERVSSRYHLGTEIPWAEKFWDTERNGPDAGEISPGQSPEILSALSGLRLSVSKGRLSQGYSYRPALSGVRGWKKPGNNGEELPGGPISPDCR